MKALLWCFFLLCLVFISDGVDVPGPEMLFRQDLIQKNIGIRLVKRDWKPEGPSANTDEVMEEYRWSVNEAFQALIKSSWKYTEVPLRDAEKLFESDDFSPDKESIFILHPVLASANVFFVKTTITALAMRNLHKKYNIFAVNMPWNNPQMIYSIFKTTFGTDTHFEPMAEAVSKVLVTGVGGGHLKLDRIHLLGWSYSGQLVGYIGRYMYAKYGSKIASIVALDPYSNSVNGEVIHVSAYDADVVQVYHTNSLVAGTRERVGTADIVFNAGIIQPECQWPAVLRNSIKESMICSHMKVVQRFWYVILYPSKFVGRKCFTWNHFTHGFCMNTPTTTLSYPIKTDSKAEGTYYMRTLDTKPYGLGKWGSFCDSKTLISMHVKDERIKA